MSTSDLIKQWYDEVWNKANESFIDVMMHKDVIVHGLDPAGTSHGIEHFKAFYKNFRESFPTVHVVVRPLVSDDEFTTVHCSVSAKSATGKEVSFSGLCVGHYNKDGQLIEGWNNFDFLKMYQQLGHILVADIEEKI
ncbi:MAG TPA: ester cyclase [Chitinophagaceae bacterium]